MENTLVTQVGTLITAITSAIPIATLLALVGSVLAAGLGYAVVWFGIKYAVPRLMAAVKGGKVKA